MNFHPCITELIATSSIDGTCQVWNILNSQCTSKVTCNDAIFSSDWNYDGSLLGLTSKEKLIKIFDPRKNEVVHSLPGFDGIKTQKMLFMGNTNYFCVTGFSRNERQLRLYDLKNLEKPIQTLSIDSASASLQPFYDPDINVLFITGKGESTVRYYELINGNFKKAADYSSSDPAKSSTFLPKRLVNYNKCEMDTMVKLTKNWVGYVHFYFPKKVIFILYYYIIIFL